MFCPNCKTEYREGFTRCADCGVELVRSLDSAPYPDAGVVLWKGSDPVLASRFSADLEAEGIPFHAAQGIAPSLYGAGLASMPTFVIHVPPGDEARAMQLVQRAMREPVPVEETSPDSEAAPEPKDDEPEPPMPGTTLAEFLAWFVPTFSYYFYLTWWAMDPHAKSDPLSRLALSTANLFGWFGFFWMFYQAARYERRPTKYIALAFVPFAFIWYWVRRYPFRVRISRLPAAVR